MKQAVFLIAMLLFLGQNLWAKPIRDVYPDTWAATDSLGRRLPGNEECGGPRKDKTVMIFYFVWHGQHGQGGPYDITKILSDNPDNPKWGPPGSFHFWGEPELGYYVAGDTYVIRRHMRMLAAAGVDAIAIDVTNAFTYHKIVMKTCEVLRRMRNEGVPVPKITFMTNSAHVSTMERLYNDFYKPGHYSELWFRWLGKPLVLSNSDGLPGELKDFFTFRQSWAWGRGQVWFKDGFEKWPWLDFYPQAVGWREAGKAEMISASVAQHPVSNIGRSYHKGRQPATGELRTDEGLYFAEQLRYALKVDPEVLFITGWNEWTAQRYLANGKTDRMLGRLLKEGESFFVDAYTQEFNRDVEPMKGGHTDNYYYQLVDAIRRFKGVRKPDAASPPRTVIIDGNFDDWADVKPEYRDWERDTEHRRSRLWGEAGMAVNTTGRNDFTLLKVARDSSHVYFYAKTREPISPPGGKSWMLLFVDTDQNHRTGWNGYDLLINSKALSPSQSAVQKNAGGWSWNDAGKASLRVRGNEMEIAVPIRLIQPNPASALSFDFHWADNIRPGDLSSFFTDGDSAPDRRFNYRYATR